MNLALAVLIIVLATGVAVGAMLAVRCRNGRKWWRPHLLTALALS